MRQNPEWGQFGPDLERTQLFLEPRGEGGGCLPHLRIPVLPQGNISVCVCCCCCFVCVVYVCLELDVTRIRDE